MYVKDVVFLTSLLQEEIEEIRLADGDSTLTEADNSLVLAGCYLYSISTSSPSAS